MIQQKRSKKAAAVVVMVPRRGVASQLLIPILVAVIGVVGTIAGALLAQSPPAPPDVHVLVQPPPPPIQPPPPPTEAPQAKTPTPEPSVPQTQKTLLDQLAAQKEEMDALKRTIVELKREADSRKDSETNRPRRVLTPPEFAAFPGADAPRSAVCSPNPQFEEKVSSRNMNSTPQPMPVLLYYRVASQQIHQVEYARIDELKHLLKSMNLSYVCGRPWKDSGLSPLWVPIAIHKTSSWRSCSAKTVAHRDRIMSKMSPLGIDTRIEKPEEDD